MTVLNVITSIPHAVYYKTGAKCVAKGKISPNSGTGKVSPNYKHPKVRGQGQD